MRKKITLILISCLTLAAAGCENNETADNSITGIQSYQEQTGLKKSTSVTKNHTETAKAEGSASLFEEQTPPSQGSIPNEGSAPGDIKESTPFTENKAAESSSSKGEKVPVKTEQTTVQSASPETDPFVSSEHIHEWKEHTETRHHKAITHCENMMTSPEEDVPVFTVTDLLADVDFYICSTCAFETQSEEEIVSHVTGHFTQVSPEASGISEEDPGYRTETREVKTGTQNIQTGTVRKPASYSQITLTDKEAWDEEVTVYKCECGKYKDMETGEEYNIFTGKEPESPDTRE